MEPQIYHHNTVIRAESVELYRQYQSLNIQLAEAKHDRWYGIFGYLGFGTLLGIYLVVLMVPLFLPALQTMPTVGYLTMLVPFMLLWSLYRFLIHERKREQGRGAFLPETSPSGRTLHDLPYDETLELTPDAYTAFVQTYRNPRFESGQSSREHQPLNTPVQVEDRLVISAAVELHCDALGHLQDVSHVVHHPGGTTSTITAPAFAELVSTVYTTEDGDEYLVPITTGRQQSLLWSTLGETLTVARRAQSLDGMKAKIQIPVIEYAVKKYDHLLGMLMVQTPQECV